MIIPGLSVLILKGNLEVSDYPPETIEALQEKDDKVLGPEASLLIANQIPHCELFMYEGYGHAAYDTAPDYRE